MMVLCEGYATHWSRGSHLVSTSHTDLQVHKTDNSTLAQDRQALGRHIVNENKLTKCQEGKCFYA